MNEIEMSEIESAEPSYRHILEKLRPPYDYDNPQWDEEDRVMCWRNYISEDLVNEWPNLTGRQKIIISANFQNIANQEDWE